MMRARAVGVVVAAARAEWEPSVLRELGANQVVVLRRCVDLEDLLGAALSGQVDVAVVSGALAGVDADAVRRLEGAGVGIVAITDDGSSTERMRRLGAVVTTSSGVLGAVRAAAAGTGLGESAGRQGEAAVPASHRGRSRPPGTVVAVWGPTGAPGRTTVALALAAERAAADPGKRCGDVVLCDVDPYGGTIAQRVGIVEDVSGLLAVARLANEGALDHAALASCLRTIDAGIGVLTGLPRPERWREIREGVIERLVDLARTEADVVLDCGFGIDTGTSRGLPRDTATVEALQAADEIIVVGSAEPVGLSRLARGLVALTEVVERPPSVTVVNRMRGTLGWRPADVRAMIDGFAPGVPVQFWPEERALLDRAMIGARTLPELGEHALREPARHLAASVFPGAQVPNSR